MELNENIMQLIIRFLNQEASQKEKTELDSWLNENPANQQEFDDYVKIWKDSSSLVIQHDFNTSVAWGKLDTKILPTPVEEPIRRGTLFTMKRMVAAAAILLFVTVTTIYIFNNKEASWKSISALQKNERFALPDGSIVLLRKGSALRYSANFGDKERFTELNGEAFFEVQYNEQMPFRVISTKATIEVLGTSFLVRNTNLLDEVVVTTGKVRFSERRNISNEVILTKGHKAELVKRQITKDTVLNVNYMAWQSGKLIFHNTPLKQVVDDISRFYEVKIKLAPEVEKEAGTINIKAEFDHEPLEQVLDEFQLITGLKVSKKNGVVIIKF